MSSSVSIVSWTSIFMWRHSKWYSCYIPNWWSWGGQHHPLLTFKIFADDRVVGDRWKTLDRHPFHVQLIWRLNCLVLSGILPQVMKGVKMFIPPSWTLPQHPSCRYRDFFYQHPFMDYKVKDLQLSYPFDLHPHAAVSSLTAFTAPNLLFPTFLPRAPKGKHKTQAAWHQISAGLAFRLSTVTCQLSGMHDDFWDVICECKLMRPSLFR